MGRRDKLTLEEATDLLKIDPNRLDDVCIQQSVIFDEVAERHAYAVSDRDSLKDELAKTTSKIAGELRANAAQTGDKITEKAIESKVHLDKRHIQANEDYLEAKLDADLWGIKKDATLQRSSMIKRMCELLISGYYQASTIKGTETAGKDLDTKETKKKLSEGRKSRPRRGRKE